MTSPEERADKPEALKPWREPQLEILDVADSEIFKGRGKDGSTFVNSTRS